MRLVMQFPHNVSTGGYKLLRSIAVSARGKGRRLQSSKKLFKKHIIQNQLCKCFCNENALKLYLRDK